MTILLFLFFLGLLILAHEFGHFYTAKKLGAIVEEFSIGFPPKIFSKKIKETNFSIGAILFGGFVKLKGEDNPDDPLGFWSLPAKKRLLIVLAGVFFNILLAYFLFSFSFSFGYPIPGEKIFISGFLNKNAQEKFRIGDEILAYKIEDKVYQFKNLEELAKFLKENKGKEVVVVFKRGNQILEEKGVLPIGFYVSNFQLVKEKFPKNFILGLEKTYENFKKIIVGFYQVILSLFKKEEVNLEIVGPVGIYNLFGNIRSFGWGYIFYFIGVLSLNLAFINILPFPALDGGRALFIFSEIIFRKKLDYKKEELIHKVGFILLFSLLFLVTIKDIYRLWFK